MIMIIDDDLLSYVILDQQLKITFKKSSGLPRKNPLPPKSSRRASPPSLLTLRIFQPPSPLQKGGGQCVTVNAACKPWE